MLLDVYRPAVAPARPVPAVVFIHGGGWRQGDKSRGTGLRAFAQTGDYVGFSIGYRLSGEATWPAQIYDCKAAIHWVRQNAKKLTKSDIQRHNLAILGYCHDDATRKGILTASGLSDDGSVLPGAIDLNNLDDWYEFHQAVLA